MIELIKNKKLLDLAKGLSNNDKKLIADELNFVETSTWFDGTVMDDSKADGIIYKKINNKYYADNDFLSGKPIDIRRFGAVGDRKTDDTDAFKLAAETVAKFYVANPDNGAIAPHPFSKEAFIPSIVAISDKGFRISDSVLFSKPCNLDIDLIYFSGGNKTCLILDGFINCEVKINAINASSEMSNYYIADWTQSNNEFVVLKNSEFCTFTFNRVVGFTRGIICLADGGGFYANKIYLNDLQNMLSSFIIKSQNNGWPNENQVYGGVFGATTGHQHFDINTPRRAFIRVESDGTYGANSWLFIGQGFEGKIDINDLNTLVLDSTDYGLQYSIFKESRYEAITDVPNLDKKPLFLLGLNTLNNLVETNLYNDNGSYALLSNGNPPDEFQFLSKEMKIEWASIININIDEIKKSGISVGNNIAVSGKYDIVGILPYRSHVGYENFWIGTGSVGYLIEVKPNVTLKLVTSDRITIIPLKSDFSKIANHADILGAETDLSRINGSVDYPTAYFRSAAKRNIFQSELFKTNSNLNFKYLFITGDLGVIQVFYDIDKEKPKFIGSRPERQSYSDYYITDSNIENSNTSVERGMRIYDIVNNVEYLITKSGSTGVDTAGHRFSGVIGDNVLTDEIAQMEHVLKVGQYGKLGDNRFKIVDINVVNNKMTISPALTSPITNIWFSFDPPEYIRPNLKRIGTTAERPVLKTFEKGFIYFDTTINKSITWTGIEWKDVTGTIV